MKLPGLRLRLATSQLIRQWAQRRLPNGKIISGQILNPKTINYQTHKPERDGLFCERIFGPINDSICACGRPLRGQKFCSRCEVEYVSPRVRRYRLGYIQLITATAHVWFFKGRPSYFSLFLNLSKKKIECLLYCTKNISRTIFPLELNFYSIRKFNRVQKINLRNCILIQSFFKKNDWLVLNRSFRPSFPTRSSRGPMGPQRRRAAPAASGPQRRAAKAHFGSAPLTGNSPHLAQQGAFYWTLKKFQNLKYIERKTVVSVNTVIDLFGYERTMFQILQRNAMKLARAARNKKKFLSSSIFYNLKTKKKFYFQSNFGQNRLKDSNSMGWSYQKKSQWQKGGLRDAAIYFGFSLVSKTFSWRRTTHWLSFVYFLIQTPFRGDLLNKYYPGPPGLVQFWGLESRLYCTTGVQLMRTWLTQLTQNRCRDGRLLEIQIRLDLLQFEGRMLRLQSSQGRLRAPSPLLRLQSSQGGSPLGGSRPRAQACRIPRLRTPATQRRSLRETPLSDNEFVQRILLFRRFKYLRSFRHTQINPASMILNVLPVLPPDLRPIVQLDNNQIAVSDFNKLYQTVLLRNKRLSRLTVDQNSHCLNSEALQYSQRLLQESVDSLIDNGKVSSSGGERPLKSLSDLFKGKKGRFRQNLLGKRVDYSGRSVIVVGPYLKIHECGLPKEIAYELFQPFLLRILMFQNQAQTILGAKKLLQQKPLFIWSLLKEVVHSYPILLNRAPSLHRLSIQAFQPRLIEGKAILLHPLVCAAFNADFDGDQMGVHLPLCFEARAEAWKITWSQNNLFSVATGFPTCSPSQDMILGSSFLTMQNTQKFGFNVLKIFTKNLNFFENSIMNSSQARVASIWKKWLTASSAFGLSQRPLGGASALSPVFIIKRLLFKKPFFFKSISKTSDIYFDKKSDLKETTLLDLNVISFVKKSHPFSWEAQGRCVKAARRWGGSPPLDACGLRSKDACGLRSKDACGLRSKDACGLRSKDACGLRSKEVMNSNIEKEVDIPVVSSKSLFIDEKNVFHRFSQNFPVWCSYNPILNKFETEKKRQKLIEIRIYSRGNFQKFRSQIFQQYHPLSGVELLKKIRTTYGRIKFYENLVFFNP